MSTLKAEVDHDRALDLVRSSFPDAEDLTPLASGEASQAFSFVSGGQRLVLRVNHSRPYARDAWAAKAFAGTEVPVPAVIASGKEGHHFWVVSERVVGTTLGQPPREPPEPLLPDLMQVLARIHEMPPPAGDGYGYVDDEGIARSPSWRAFLEGEGKRHSFIEWDRVPNEAEPRTREFLLAAWEAGDRLVPYCPEVRALVHGDFSLDNVLSDGTRITGVVDWGGIYGDPLWDVAWLDFWVPRLAFADLWLRQWPSEHGEERLSCYRMRIAAFAIGFYLQTGQPDRADFLAQRAEAQLAAAANMP